MLQRATAPVSLPFSAPPQRPPALAINSVSQQTVTDHVLHARPRGQSRIWQGPGRTCPLSLGNLQCLGDSKGAGGKFIDLSTFSFADLCTLTHWLICSCIHSFITSLLPLTHPFSHWLIYSFSKHCIYLILPRFGAVYWTKELGL